MAMSHPQVGKLFSNRAILASACHWHPLKLNDILMKFQSLAIPKVVILTTCSVASDENVIKLTTSRAAGDENFFKMTFPFQCCEYIFPLVFYIQTLTCIGHNIDYMFVNEVGECCHFDSLQEPSVTMRKSAGQPSHFNDAIRSHKGDMSSINNTLNENNTLMSSETVHYDSTYIIL